MENIKIDINNNKADIKLIGHIDSKNAPQLEAFMDAELGSQEIGSVILDCSELEYISSAGLRLILKLRKKYQDVTAVELSPEVYDIFELTGFTELLNVRKRFREISVEGCEIIGSGVNGDVYRIDDETIVKLYKNSDALSDIETERSLARKAFVKGIPTAIPYDTVKIGEYYGSVFELLNSKSLAKVLAEDNSTLDTVTHLYVDLLKKIHSTEFREGELPQMGAKALTTVDAVSPYLSEAAAEKLKRLVGTIPDDCHMVHGDYHLKNVMLQNGEAILIDMDTISLGNPIFDFGYMFNTYVGYGELIPNNSMEFLHVPQDVCGKLYYDTIRLYFPGITEDEINELVDKAAVLGFMRIMKRFIKKEKTEEHDRYIAICRKNIEERVSRLDRLYI